ncbi:MAG: phosphotransferase family protein [Parvibaculum sp.]|nr:phosphotransferase family protein [Parvibaculum sp.]|tara:strand:- start:101 stop:1150 length:1050 start_codon:yes stop_codon:yes gene_type:complete
MSLESWTDLVDLERLTGWMDEQGLEKGPLTAVTALTGGTQNILLKFRRGSRDFVLRRPPHRPHMNGSETMRREARVLGALAGSDVPHPGLIAACAEEDVLGAAFYLMEPVDGFNATVGLPPLHAGNASVRREMGLAIADGAAALGRVDYVAVGLTGLGKPENYLERQVARWRGQLESYAEYEGWAGPGDIPGVERVAKWLGDNCPRDFKPGVIHGDYHLANVMYRHDSGQLAAIVDWELTTIGDPLIDLGWLMATWPDADGVRTTGSVGIQPWEGFPTAPELIARYAEGSTRDLSAIGWYAVLACYKLGIILEGTNARAAAGKAPRETGDMLHASTIGLFRRALGWIDT